jgi:hypothetical protein
MTYRRMTARLPAGARTVPTAFSRWTYACRITRLCLQSCALLFGILAASCRDADRVQQYAKTHAATLVTDTRPVWTRYRLAADIPESEYTRDMRALKPDRVTASDAGVWLYINTTYPYVTGIFIRYDPSFPTPSDAPPDSDNMTYRRLGNDVFWFSKPR